MTIQELRKFRDLISIIIAAAKDKYLDLEIDIDRSTMNIGDMPKITIFLKNTPAVKRGIE